MLETLQSPTTISALMSLHDKTYKYLVVTSVFYITKPHLVNAVVGDPLNLDDNLCYGAKIGSDHTKFSFSIV